MVLLFPENIGNYKLNMYDASYEYKMKSLSHVRLFETSWTVFYQAPLSMGFSRQGY